MENWKPIVDYEGIYDVSDLGNVRSIVDRKNSYAGKILKPQNKKGYRTLGLTVDNKTKWRKASRLVALAFLPNPQNKPPVNHKDGIKSNDILSNLEWATISENTKHAFDTGLAKVRITSKLTPLGVAVIKGLLKSRYTPAKVAEIFGVHQMTIFDIKWGRTWVDI